MTPVSKPLIHGIDISHWDGDIDFARVKNDGIEIVYIKSSEGQSLIDPKFETYYHQARDHGLKIGFYHYVTARTKAQAKAEAHFFISVIEEKEFDCLPVMDFEALFDLSHKEINKIAKEFMEAVEYYSGKKSMLYSDASNASSVFDPALARYPLWIAQYGVKEPSDNGKWLHWTGWQYTASGTISGIKNEVDRDYFTKEVSLEDKSPIHLIHKKPDLTESSVSYKIKYGDTLSQIASRYHTTAEKIAADNGIDNPDKIPAGKTLKIRLSSQPEEKEVRKKYKIKKGDTLTSIARKFHIPLSRLIKENHIENPDKIYAGDTLLIRYVR